MSIAQVIRKPLIGLATLASVSSAGCGNSDQSIEETAPNPTTQEEIYSFGEQSGFQRITANNGSTVYVYLREDSTFTFFRDNDDDSCALLLLCFACIIVYVCRRPC